MSESNSKPTVATITATFNRAHTLKRALQSCQNQSYRVNEIIVVDDGSTDPTPDLVTDLAARDPRIRYFRLPANRGEMYAHIEGIKMSRSDWVALVDSDDELLPHSIETRLATAGNCGFEPGLVFGDLYLKLARKDSSIERRYERLKGHVYPKLFRKIFICQSTTMMIRRDCFKTTGFPSIFWPHFQDRVMALTIAKHFPLLHCGDFVSIMYDDGGNRLSDGGQRARDAVWLWIKTYAFEIVRHQGFVCLFFWLLQGVQLQIHVLRRETRKRSRFLDYAMAATVRLLPLYFKELKR